MNVEGGIHPARAGLALFREAEAGDSRGGGGIRYRPDERHRERHVDQQG